MPSKNKVFTIIFKNFLKAVAAIIIAIIALLFFSRQIVKISESLAEQRASAFILEKKNDVITQLSEDFNLIGDADKKIENAFPPAENILGFVAALETLSNQTSLNQVLSFGTPVVSSIDYNIKLSGNISNLISYLKRFEKLPYFTEISSINLSASSGNWENDSLISLEAKIHTK
ncbi:MAG: hypothetical protein AAB596_02090 [Patescibacteria group bacterium]